LIKLSFLAHELSWDDFLSEAANRSIGRTNQKDGGLFW